MQALPSQWHPSRAVANLNKTQAKAVAKKIKEALASSPDEDVDTLIATARAGV